MSGVGYPLPHPQITTDMMSSSRVASSVRWPFDSTWPLSCRLSIGKNPLFPIVSEISSQKCYKLMTSLLTSSIMWPFEAGYVTSYSSSIEIKPVSRLVFEIFSFRNFIVMIRHHWRNDAWIDCPCGTHESTHYAVDDYVKRGSNADKKCRRRSILKVVMSRL